MDTKAHKSALFTGRGRLPFPPEVFLLLLPHLSQSQIYPLLLTCKEALRLCLPAFWKSVVLKDSTLKMAIESGHAGSFEHTKSLVYRVGVGFPMPNVDRVRMRNLRRVIIFYEPLSQMTTKDFSATIEDSKFLDLPLVAFGSNLFIDDVVALFKKREFPLLELESLYAGNICHDFDFLDLAPNCTEIKLLAPRWGTLGLDSMFEKPIDLRRFTLRGISNNYLLLLSSFERHENLSYLDINGALTLLQEPDEPTHDLQSFTTMRFSCLDESALGAKNFRAYNVKHLRLDPFRPFRHATLLRCFSKDLVSLDLSYHERQLIDLTPILTYFTNIEALNLRGCNLPASIPGLPFRSISSLPIKIIYLRNAKNVTNSFLRFISKMCPNLEVLELCGEDLQGSFDDSGLNLVMRKCTKLTALSLTFGTPRYLPSFTSDVQVKNTLEGVKTLQKLRGLELNFVDQSEKVAKYVVKCVQFLHTLEYLKLLDRECDEPLFTQYDLESIVDGTGRFLRTLDISDLKIDSSQVSAALARVSGVYVLGKIPDIDRHLFGSEVGYFERFGWRRVAHILVPLNHWLDFCFY